MPRGHASLVIEERGVLIAADMLSDVLIPLLDLNGAADPIEDYPAALRLVCPASFAPLWSHPVGRTSLFLRSSGMSPVL